MSFDPTNTRLLKQLLRTLERVERLLAVEKASLHERRESAPEDNQSYDKEEPGPKIAFNPVVNLPPSITGYYDSEQQERERKKLWERIKRVIEFVGLFIALGLAWLNLRTLSEISSQAESAYVQVRIMRQQLEAADRPWLKVISARPANDLTFDGHRPEPLATARLTIVAKNVGRSVAVGAFVQGRMTFAIDDEVLIKEQEDVCFNAKRTQPGPQLNIFPDDESGDNFFILGAEYVPDRGKSAPPAVLTGEVPSDIPSGAWIASPKFVGCIVYTIASTQTKHHTGFIYGLAQEIAAKNGPSGFIYHPTFFEVGTNIPKERLIIEPYALGLAAN